MFCFKASIFNKVPNSTFCSQISMNVPASPAMTLCCQIALIWSMTTLVKCVPLALLERIAWMVRFICRYAYNILIYITFMIKSMDDEKNWVLIGSHINDIEYTSTIMHFESSFPIETNQDSVVWMVITVILLNKHMENIIG